jgi:hypothetical protein
MQEITALNIHDTHNIMYNFNILAAFFMGCGTWSLTIREERKMRVF